MSENDANLVAFDVDLQKFAEKIGLAPKIVVIRITLDLYTRIVKRTPVDTGRARSSWDVKEGTPSDFLPPEVPKGGAAAAPQDGAGLVADLTGDKVVFITTNVDYMKYLESGSSSQAPAGMVLLSVAELEVEIESILSQL